MVKILVIKPSSLGDIIHSVEAVARLARSHPESRITWIANEEFVEFVRELPGVSEVLPFPRAALRRRPLPLRIRDAAMWLRGLRQGFDIAVDLQGLQRSGLMARFSGARERFGPAGARELAWVHYNRPIAVPDDLVHAADRVSYLAGAVSSRSRLFEPPQSPRLHGTGSSEPPFRLRPPAWAREQARAFARGDDRPLVVLAPGARWASKLWPAERWAGLLGLLVSRRPELRPVFLGAPGEESLADGPRSIAGVEVESLVGNASLWLTAALMERAAGVVTMDSAPLHLAAAVGAPTVSLFGPTAPERVGPRGSGHRVLRPALECLACYHRWCPLPERLCLPGIPEDEVFEALEEVLRPAPECEAAP